MHDHGKDWPRWGGRECHRRCAHCYALVSLLQIQLLSFPSWDKGWNFAAHLCFAKWLPVTLCRWGSAERDCRAGGGRRGLLLPVSHFYHRSPSGVSSPRRQFLPITANESCLCFPGTCRSGFVEPISGTPAPAEHTALQRCVSVLQDLFLVFNFW